MNDFQCPLQLRWSDLDPNFHVRHSAYYDWGAYCRIEFLYRHGLGSDVMEQIHFGPILFREECIFRKEIRMGDNLLIDLKLSRCRKDTSRWSIRHEITKNDGILCALLTVDGAWMDTTKRKLGAPPEIVNEVFHNMPRTGDFEWI
jgi:acyl-CoA thioester hydrolase